jgi:hypothetical protein
VEVSLQDLKTITKGPPVRDVLGSAHALFKLRQPVDLFHVLKTVKGILNLVSPRTSWSSGYGVLCTCGLCYMLRDCLVSARMLFKIRQPIDLFHTLKTVKGLLHFVPSRTPWNSEYGVLCTCGLCYMLFLLYV